MSRTLKPHTLQDHLQGADGVHSHEEGSDHDHDHDDFGEYDPENDALWLQDHITLVSVGIDIGSSGTQVIFSRVHMSRMSEDLTSRYFVVKRETLHQSPWRSRPTSRKSASTSAPWATSSTARTPRRESIPTRSARAR